MRISDLSSDVCSSDLDYNYTDGNVDRSGLDQPNTTYLLNGAYFRVKNVTLGYSLPYETVQRWGMSRLRFFVTGEKIFEFSEVKRFVDPEAINWGTDSSAWAYPFQRRFAFGLNIGF